ncbi:MAG: ribosomal protein S18-alanine N-acetyltransferase [Proteobacteria bacterium]|nr:ribosomal protein S18-alanine N-acetyltransferase [Pseudomonadota bacterium]
MTIREATAQDISGLADLHARAFAHAWDRAAMQSLLKGHGVFAFIAGEGEVDGFIMVRVAADETEILSIAVSPDARRRGLGSRLLTHAAQRAAGLGAVRMFLEVAAKNLPARNLYEKHGFRQVGARKAYYEDGGDALVLASALPLAMGNSKETL